MKLATRKTSGPDGELLVVSRDLRKAAQASAVAATLLEALSRWQEVVLRLQAIYERLNADQAADAFPFQPEAMAAPLPRAPQWLDGSAFHSHGDLMQRVFGLEAIEGKLEVPLMYQGASDDFLGPCQDMPLPSEDDGIDIEA
jgi:fumarylacetoacetate (FAA) hydrolase